MVKKEGEKMTNVEKFVKSSVIYFVGNVLTKLISFFLLPLYTRYIPSNEMGYYDLSTLYINMFLPVVFLEIWTSVMRFMFDHIEKKEKYSVVFNGICIFCASFFVYSVAFWWGHNYFSFEYPTLIYLYGIFLAIQFLYSYIARGLGYDKVFAVSGIIGSLVNSLSNIFMILCLNMTIESLYLALCIGLITQIIIMESKVHIVSKISFSMWNPILIKKMILFSLPLCLNQTCYWLMSGYNKIAVSNILGLEANGIYSIAGKFTLVISLVATCFSMAWQELAYSQAENQGKEKLYSVAANYYIIFLSLAILLYIPLIKIIFPYFVAKQYEQAFDLIPLYVIATALSLLNAFLGDVFGAEKKTNVILISTFCGGIVNVVAFHLLVGKYHIQAANMALIIGFLTIIIIKAIILRRNYKVVLNKPIIILASIFLVIGTILYMSQNLIVNCIWSLIVLVIYLVKLKDVIASVFKKVKSKR